MGEYHIHPSVFSFAKIMDRQLKASEHKGGWESEDPRWLYVRLIEEAAGLGVVISMADAMYPAAAGSVAIPVACLAKIATEAADVANFAMMILDRFIDKAEEAVTE